MSRVEQVSQPLTKEPVSSPAGEGRPLRVLLVSSSSGSHGGGEYYLSGLASGLAAAGHTVDALLADHVRMDGLAMMLAPHSTVHRLRYANTYDRRLRCGGAVLDRRQIAALAACFRRLQPDIVHVNKQNLEDGLDLVLAARRSGLPFLATIHVTRTMQSLGAALGRWRDRLSLSVLRRTACPVLAIASSCARDLGDASSSLAAEDVFCVQNGVAAAPPGNRAAIRREWGCSEQDVVLGCVARVEAQKNPLFLVRLLTRLPEHIKLVWIGDGRLREPFLAIAEKAGVTNRVRLDGWQSDARARMAGFDVFVLPSQYEGLPLALLEAMAAGLPCVAADVDGVQEALADGETGRLCGHDDELAWGEALTALAADHRLRTHYGQNAQDRYQRQFSLAAMTRGTLAVYRKVISRNLVAS